MVSIQYSEEVILIGKALLIAILGVLLGFISKYFLRKVIDKSILKRIFRDPNIYETSSFINKVFTETLQWVIIIGAVNYSLMMLEFNFLSNALEYIIANISLIAGFVIIILAGLFVARIVTSIIKRQDMEHRNEIVTLVELVIMAAFFLTAIEFVGITATALVELYKVVLYVIAILIVVLIIRPQIFEKHKGRNKSGKKKESSTKLFSL